jgi:hypothetical protein
VSAEHVEAVAGRLAEGALAARVLPDGRELVVYPLLTGTARLVVSAHPGAAVYDDGW